MQDFEVGDTVEVQLPVTSMGDLGAPGDPVDFATFAGRSSTWEGGVIEGRAPDGRNVVSAPSRPVEQLHRVIVGRALLRRPAE